jgi:hypothetical protein
MQEHIIMKPWKIWLSEEMYAFLTQKFREDVTLDRIHTNTVLNMLDLSGDLADEIENLEGMNGEFYFQKERFKV